MTNKLFVAIYLFWLNISIDDEQFGVSHVILFRIKFSKICRTNKVKKLHMIIRKQCEPGPNFVHLDLDLFYFILFIKFNFCCASLFTFLGRGIEGFIEICDFLSVSLNLSFVWNCKNTNISEIIDTDLFFWFFLLLSINWIRRIYLTHLRVFFPKISEFSFICWKKIHWTFEVFV